MVSEVFPSNTCDLSMRVDFYMAKEDEISIGRENLIYAKFTVLSAEGNMISSFNRHTSASADTEGRKEFKEACRKIAREWQEV